MNTRNPVRLVGAYAALPPSRYGQERFYEGLAERGVADGLEIPFRDALVDDTRWLAEQIGGRFEHSVLTLIPGTMTHVGATGKFGLASPDPDGRQAAIDHLGQARKAAEQLNQLTGEPSISVIHIHTAPSRSALSEMFARSLAEISSEVTAEGAWTTELVLEHCDAYDPGVPGEKRFLSLDDEIPLARDGGIGITVNWGRSVIEAQDPRRAHEHIGTLAAAGLLRGVMFSGAGPTGNQFGGPWADAHLPLTEDEPTSLLDLEQVRRCLLAAGDDLAYAGAKIQVPVNTPIERRLEMIGRITQLLRDDHRD